MTTLKYGWKLFLEQCCSKKCGVVVLLLFFINHFFLSGIKDFCSAVNCNITPYFFPFLISFVYYQLFYTMIVMYSFSNVPFQDYSQMYQLIRLGNTRWTLGHVIYILLNSIFLVLVTVGEGILIMIPKLDIGLEWGKVIRTLAVSNAEEEYNLYAIPFDNVFMNHYSAITGMGLAIGISIFVTFFLGMLMFGVSVYFGRIAALFAASVEIVLPIFCLNLSYGSMYRLNAIAPVAWLSLVSYEAEKMGFRVMPDIRYIFLMMIPISLCLVGLTIYRTKRMEIYFIKEE